MTTLRSQRRPACLAAMMAALALVVAAPVASAQTSQGGYAPPSSNVQAEIQDSPTAPQVSSTPPRAATNVQRSQASGSLPFTGLDLGFIGLAGVGLLAIGFSLRRITTRGARADQRNAA